MSDGRTLSDDDIKALVIALTDPVAEAVMEGLAEKLQLEVGKGVLAWIKRALIGMLIIFAAYMVAHESGMALTLSQRQ